jgi:hypothetical protein
LPEMKLTRTQITGSLIVLAAIAALALARLV